MLRLFYFWNSTCSHRVLLQLAEKGLSWEGVHVDISKHEQLADWYLSMNPNNVVPTLEHDGRFVVESNVILEYLEDVFPAPSLRPAIHWEKARMRIWMDMAEHVVHANVNKISYNRIFWPQMKDIPGDQLEQTFMQYTNAARREEKLRRLEHGISAADEDEAIRRLTEVMDEMEDTLGRQPWLAGGSFSLADISVAPFVARFETNCLASLVDWQTPPAVGEWWQRIKARPSYAIAISIQKAAAASQPLPTSSASTTC